jgi:beta-lactamase superfamily II metal-dependent hydrolase
MDHAFAALPDDYAKVFLYDDQGDPVRHVLWGDWLWIDDSKPDTDPIWRHVVWSPNNPAKRRQLRVKRDHTTKERPLEIVFVDVGQGDGAVLITPERNEKERIIVVDAGKGDEMGKFLDARFGSYRRGFTFHAGVLTHPDKDHYFGFKPIFESGKIRFRHFYHNGIVEFPTGSDFAGAGGTVADGGVTWMKTLVEDDAGFRQAFAGANSKRDYAAMMSLAIANNAVTTFAMLSTEHGVKENGKTWMPDFQPSAARDYTIEVLGPFAEAGPNGPRLRKIGKYSETKNGHSVLLRLSYKNFNVLFGGDLNLLAEQFLLKSYAGFSKWPTKPVEREEMIAKTRERFQSEVLKVCHHGATDVTDEFLEAVNPAAFVISSGDAEGHVHPRPDLLGRLGRKGRGNSPVLLSTELQRSVRDREDAKLVDTLRADIERQVSSPTPQRKKAIDEAIRILSRSNVEVDGAIYLKTDGARLITAFKKEDKSDKDKWFYFEYRILDGKLVLVPR